MARTKRQGLRRPEDPVGLHSTPFGLFGLHSHGLTRDDVPLHTESRPRVVAVPEDRRSEAVDLFGLSPVETVAGDVTPPSSPPWRPDHHNLFIGESPIPFTRRISRLESDLHDGEAPHLITAAGAPPPPAASGRKRRVCVNGVTKLDKFGRARLRTVLHAKF